MLGWDFVPYFSNGLDCLSDAMLKIFFKNNFEVHLLLPYRHRNQEAVELTDLKPVHYESAIKNKEEEIDVYASRAKSFVRKNHFDAVYCNRWLAYKAAVEAKKISGKPLVIHVRNAVFNATFDSLRGDIEKEAFQKADRIIVSSEHLRRILRKKYNINDKKIKLLGFNIASDNVTSGNEKNIMLFAGGIKQKDMEYFARIAKDVVDCIPGTNFFVVSADENLKTLVNRAMDFRIIDSIKHVKCDTGDDLRKIVSKSRILLVPNASDAAINFSLVSSGIPAVVDRNSEIKKIFRNVIISDFWDTKQTSSKVISLIKHDDLVSEIKSGISEELKNYSTKERAVEIKEVFEFG